MNTKTNRWSFFTDYELIVIKGLNFNASLPSERYLLDEIDAEINNRSRLKQSEVDPWNEGEDPWTKK